MRNKSKLGRTNTTLTPDGSVLTKLNNNKRYKTFLFPAFCTPSNREHFQTLVHVICSPENNSVGKFLLKPESL